MRYFRVGKDSLTPWLFLCALFVAACSSQDPSFKEDITTKTKYLDVADSGDAIGVPADDGGRNPIDGVQDLDPNLDSGSDDSSGNDPIILVAGKDEIDPDLFGSDGSGDGSSDGSGDGSGDGSSDGSGDGSGDGSSDGSGDGSGDGEGTSVLGKTEKVFAAAQVLTGEKLVAIEQPRSDTFTLTRAYHAASQNFTQLTRANLMDAFQQGASGNSTTDSFLQTTQTGVLDVLIVIDNSGSMSQEQNNLATKLQPLLSYVQGSDWRIGVVTTDYRNGCIRDVIRKNDADYEQKFATAIQAGISGSGTEIGIRTAVEGLKGECLTEPWLRANSTVAVLIVSDEDNCSNGSGCSGQAWQYENYLVDYLDSIRTAGDDARVYGLFWHPTAVCSTAAYKANIYAAAVTQTNGTWGSICDANYTGTLQAISQNIGTILKHQFVLAHAPDAGTTQVRVGGVIMASGWNVAGTVITFDQAPPDGSAITVSYSYGSTPIMNTFTLSQPASSDGIEVKANNAVVASSAYDFDAGQNAIVFDQYPAENAAIEVKFKEKVTFLSSFHIGTDAADDSVTVKVNNTALAASDFSYNSASGHVVLDNAPPESAGVKISYMEGGDPILAYPYSLDMDQTNILVTDVATGNEITASYDAQNTAVVIGLPDFVEGKKIRVSNPDAEPASFVETWYDTGAELVPASAHLELGDQSCLDIDYSETSLGIERCDLTGLEGNEGTLVYKFVTNRQHRFAIDPAFFEQEHGYQIWAVYVDGNLFTEFILDGSTVVISDDLEADSEIKIKVTLLKAT